MIERKISLVPEPDTMVTVQGLVEETLEEALVPMKIAMKMDIVVDEIYSNIINYSKAENAQVICRVEDGQVHLIFMDDGVAYNPLEKKDPDITLSVEERDIGGLGIFLSKKLMDQITYEHKDGYNKLHVVKGV